MFWYDTIVGTWLLIVSAPGVPGKKWVKIIYLLLGCWMIAGAGA